MLKGNLVAYSGMTTKIRAMKNKLLSPEQYEEITHFTTVAELISFLQTTPIVIFLRYIILQEIVRRNI